MAMYYFKADSDKYYLWNQHTNINKIPNGDSKAVILYL